MVDFILVPYPVFRGFPEVVGTQGGLDGINAIPVEGDRFSRSSGDGANGVTSINDDPGDSDLATSNDFPALFFRHLDVVHDTTIVDGA